MKPDLFVYLFHILFVGSIFLYVGIRRKYIPKWLFFALATLGVIIIAYHFYKSILHKKPYWINVFHICVVGPLLIYIGVNGEDTERMYFEFLLMLGFAVIGYHSYYSLHE
jgi:peptidoglycan/LPS O-acetylase OafA/YrhL